MWRARGRLETLNRDTHAIVVAVGKEKTAVLLRYGSDVPPRSRQLCSLSDHGGAQIRSGRERAVFEGAARTVAHDQPAHFATDVQSIGSTASCDHTRIMTQPPVSSANVMREYWMR
jgi:hypothetical protein